MRDLQKSCKIAVVQAAPVLFDKKACVEKAVALIKECAENKAELIVFPELFIPGYPYGMTFGFTVGSSIMKTVLLYLALKRSFWQRRQKTHVHGSVLACLNVIP